MFAVFQYVLCFTACFASLTKIKVIKVKKSTGVVLVV